MDMDSDSVTVTVGTLEDIGKAITGLAVMQCLNVVSGAATTITIIAAK